MGIDAPNNPDRWRRYAYDGLGNMTAQTVTKASAPQWTLAYRFAKEADQALALGRFEEAGRWYAKVAGEG